MQRKYKEDYMEDRDLIYYPVHLTPGYDTAVKAGQYMHGVSAIALLTFSIVFSKTE